MKKTTYKLTTSSPLSKPHSEKSGQFVLGGSSDIKNFKLYPYY